MAVLANRLKRASLFKRKSKLNKVDGFQKFLYVLLTLVGSFMIMPLIFIFNNAFKPLSELFIFPPRIWVRQPTFQNFIELFTVTSSSVVPVSRYLFNSIVVTIIVVVSVTIISALCAYPISKHKFPGSKLLFSTILLTLMFVPEAVQIPRYLVAVNIGIINNYWGHVLPLLAAPVGVFLMKQFIDGVPNELLEAAKIDGAKEFYIFLRIVIPIVMPAVATIAILQFQEVWRNTETSTLYMQDEAMKTFPFFMSTLLSGMANSVARQGAAAASAMIMFLPNFIIFMFFQKKVIATMAHSGIK
jgi:ABC-type glycerol-3-phosphate transport system permease component